MRNAAQHVKRVTLTSKKNWWMVELDGNENDQDDRHHSANSFSSSDTAVSQEDDGTNGAKNAALVRQHSSPANPSVPPSPMVFNIPRHPSSIFSFPTPTSYSAPPNPTANLSPVAQGSASELFKCIVKKPEVVELEINGEMQSNASDVTTQFLAELRVYTTLSRHRNVCAFLGCLESVGMVLEYIDGRTLYDVLRADAPFCRMQKIDYHNQLLDGLTHLHSYGLSHGDLSLLNIQVQNRTNTIKLLDFGRSVSAHSEYASPDAAPPDPLAHLQAALTASLRRGGVASITNGGRNAFSSPRPDESSVAHALEKTLSHHPPRKIEQIHPGTRPFSAPEILRGECQDPLLADAYSFGMILVCLDRGEAVDVKPWDARKDLLPKGFLDKCEVFRERAAEYLRRFDTRRRLLAEDEMKA